MSARTGNASPEMRRPHAAAGRRTLAAAPIIAQRVVRAAAALTLCSAAQLGAAGSPPPGRSGPQEPEPAPRHAFGERIEVSRVIVEARVIDGRNEHVAGLGASDFEVRLDGRPAEVEAVEWHAVPAVTGDAAAAEPLAGAASGGAAPDRSPASPPAAGLDTSPEPAPAAAPLSDLLAIFLQSADFIMEAKAAGHLRMLPRLEELVGRLAPGQRAAVLRHGGSLRLECDFTDDPERLREALRRAVLGGSASAPAADSYDPTTPSLAAGLDPERARRAASPALALAVAADALAPLPGSKSIVFVGWGLTGSGRDHARARTALAAARAPVFVLDVTSADGHLLEAGLRHLAHVTGGTYASTYHFPQGAVHRLEQTLGGRYVLVVRAPRLPPGVHPLRVRLAPDAARVGRWLLAPDAVVVPGE